MNNEGRTSFEVTIEHNTMKYNVPDARRCTAERITENVGSWLALNSTAQGLNSTAQGLSDKMQAEIVVLENVTVPYRGIDKRMVGVVSSIITRVLYDK